MHAKGDVNGVKEYFSTKVCSLAKVRCQNSEFLS